MLWSDWDVAEEKRDGVANLRWSQYPNDAGFVRNVAKYYLRLDYALAGRAADQYASVLFFHDSDAGHDMWSRSISRSEDSDNDTLHRAERGANDNGI
jgi:hypothetical protein